MLTIPYHVTIILGAVFGILSVLKKENNDYKKYVGLIGNLVLFAYIAFLNVFILSFLGYV